MSQLVVDSVLTAIPQPATGGGPCRPGAAHRKPAPVNEIRRATHASRPGQQPTAQSGRREKSLGAGAALGIVVGVRNQVASAGVALVMALTATQAEASAAPAPQPDTPCSESLAGALAQVQDDWRFLECVNQAPAGWRWQFFAGDYPSSTRFLSYGPTLTLHGEGRRNPEIKSGHWIAYPQDPDSQCAAQQTTVNSSGPGVAPPVTVAGEPGRALDLQVLPLLFSIEMSGNCLWQQVG